MTRRLGIGAVALLFLAGLTLAFAEGATLARYAYDPPLAVPPGHELVVAGENTSDRDVILVVRLDDGASTGYASRVNEERVLPPGRFTLRLAVRGLKTPSGRHLDANGIRKLIVFVPEGQPAPRLDKVVFKAGFALPVGSHGWDLGPSNGALFPGFEAVGPKDPRLSGPRIRALERPFPDPLIGDGLRGVERFRVAWPNGRWRVSLWTEDLGEWELLPHFLERRIRINRRTVSATRTTAQAWIERVYLGGRAAEALDQADPWSAFGARRGGLVSAEVEISDGTLEIELAGESGVATYLAAVLIEPAGGPPALERVQAARARRFLETWRTAGASIRPAPDRLLLWQIPFGTPIRRDSRPETGSVEPLSVAPGSAVTLDFIALAPENDGAPKVELTAPTREGAQLPAVLRAGHWRFERPNPAATLLSATTDHLRGDVEAVALIADLPRRYTVRVAIPRDAHPGPYVGRLKIESGGRTADLGFAVEVLPVALPPAARPIGVYLERAPHLNWFHDLGRERASNHACDLAFLRGLGLTGLAPPLATPVGGGLEDFVADMEAVRNAGFALPVLAYAPLKRLRAGRSPEQVGRYLARAMERMAAMGLVPPLWAIADEPSNAGRARPGLARLAAAIQVASPNARLAGQLNNPADRDYLDILDVALVNPAFGVDGDDIEGLRAGGVEPWFYNMPRPRLAAGFYLWRVGAAGYLQWHARMPTADPFDPTDGREADIQLIFPTKSVCPPVVDVHADLFALAEGIIDLRWLGWLERRSRSHPAARRLMGQLGAEIPAIWERAEDLDDQAPARWRKRITDLARRLRKET